MIPVTLPASAAESSNAAKIVFSASEPDSNGLFTVSVTAYNATFAGIQFAIEFNKDVVNPVSWTSESTASTAAECIKKESAVAAMSVFGSISEEKNKLTILGYSEDDPDFSATAGANGIKLFSIRFKVVGQGESGLCVATDKNGNGFAYDYNMISTTFVFELPTVLNGGAEPSTETTESTMTKALRAKDTIILQIGNYAAAKDGALCHIYSGEKQITPYIKTDGSNGRTMVPARFIAEKLGATVTYNGKSGTITISLNETVITMTIGSSTYTVNGVTKTMDVAAEIKNCNDGSGNGRTMVPMRFVADALGKAVYWDNVNKLVIITEASAPWQPERTAEKELTNDVLLITSPLLRDIIK